MWWPSCLPREGSSHSTPSHEPVAPATSPLYLTVQSAPSYERRWPMAAGVGTGVDVDIFGADVFFLVFCCLGPPSVAFWCLSRQHRQHRQQQHLLTISISHSHSMPKFWQPQKRKGKKDVMHKCIHFAQFNSILQPVFSTASPWARPQSSSARGRCSARPCRPRP